MKSKLHYVFGIVLSLFIISSWALAGNASEYNDKVNMVKITKKNDISKYNIEIWNIMPRRYEEGDLKVNRISFEATDMEGNYVNENPFTSIQCYDPDGIEITSGEFAFSTGDNLNGRYLPDSGTWSYPNEFTFENYFRIDFSEALKQGEYRILAQDADGFTYESTINFSGEIVEQPMISSDTFRAYKDEAGDFYFKWSIPVGIDRSVETSVRAWITAYTDEQSGHSYEIYVKVPTDLGFIVIPQNIFDKIVSSGTIFKVGVHLRNNDGTFRVYSKNVTLDENFSYTGPNAEGNSGECPVSVYPSIDDFSVLDLFLPYLNLGGTVTPLGITLERVYIESDPSGIYWKLPQ